MSADKIVLDKKDIEGNLAAGMTAVFRSTMINFEFIPQIAPGRVAYCKFVGYKYDTKDAAIIKALIPEVESADCPVLSEFEWLSAEQLDPLYAVRQKAIADYLASVNAAAVAPVGDAVAVPDGIATTKNVAVAADPQAALKAAAAGLAKPKQ